MTGSADDVPATGNENENENENYIAARFDEVLREVRRQGRAAVAAQAAAEACLDQVAALAHAADDTRLPHDATGASGANGLRLALADDLPWLDPLLPVADALDRAVVQASALVERRARSPRGRFWPFGRSAPDPELHALAEGLRVLQAQLAAALEGRGVTIDRRVGVAVDPEVHRVVEVRAGRGAESGGVVVEVVRPGYAAPGRLVREADVVATGDTLAPRPG